MSKELFAAIEQHDTARVKALLAGGADPNEPQPEPPGLRPLQVAIYELSDGGELDVLLGACRRTPPWRVGKRSDAPGGPSEGRRVLVEGGG